MSTPNTRRATRHQPTRPHGTAPMPAAATPRNLYDPRAATTLHAVLQAVDFLSPRTIFKYMRARGFTERQTLTAAAMLGMRQGWHLSDSVDLSFVEASFAPRG
jgi:hypothetical protein